MASPAKLQFRRGTFLNNLVSGEPFWDSSNRLVYIGTAVSSSIVLTKLNESNNGSLIITGDITSETITTTNGANFVGTVSISGSLLINGSESSGSTASALSGSIIPSTGSLYDIGTPSITYAHIYVDSGSFGDLTATAVPYSGITGKPTLVSGSSQITISGASDYDANRWYDHSSISILSGDGLSGGGTITTNQTLTLDTGSTHFTEGVSAVAPIIPGLVSGSSQLTGSYDTRYELSGSAVALPTGLVSGSDQLSGSFVLNIDYQTDSASFDSRIDLATSGGLTQIVDDITPQLGGDLDVGGFDITGTGNINLTGDITASVISGSFVGDGTGLTGVTSYTDADTLEYINSISVLSGSKTDISSLNTFTSSIQTEVNGLSSATSSYLQNVIEDTTPQLGGHLDLNSNIITGSGTISIVGNININSNANFFQGLSNTDSNVSLIGVSADNIVTIGNSGFENVIDDNLTVIGQVSASAFTLSGTGGNLLLDDGTTAATSSIQTLLPNGTVSGSSQLTSSYDTRYESIGTGILSGSKTDITDLNTFTSSIQTEVDGLSSATSSYLISVPTGTVSGSDQISGSFVNLSGGDTMTGTLIGTFAQFSGTITAQQATASNELVTKAQLDAAGGEYFVDLINPTGDNYPDSGSETAGAYWLINGLGTGSDYTYTTGELSGSLVEDGYKLLFNGTILQIQIPPATNWGSIGGTLSSQTDLQTELDGKENVGSGIVSGSSQISYLGITNVPANIVSGSSQLTSSYDLRYVISGSELKRFNNSYYGTASGVQNGSNTTFTVGEGEYRESSLIVYLNGQALVTGSGILESNPSTGTFDFEVGAAPSSSDAVYTTYEVGTFSTASFFDLSSSTSSVGGHILPTETETYDLGSPTNRWRDLYLSGSTIYLGQGQLSFDPSGSLEVKNNQNQAVDLVVREVIVKDDSTGKVARLSYDGTELRTRTYTSSGSLDNSNYLNTSYVQTASYQADSSSFDSRIAGMVVSGSFEYRNYVDSTSGSLIGVQNGVNTSFTSSQGSYLSGSVLAFVAGYPYSNGNGITETNPGAGIITFDTAPENFDIVIVQYSN